MRIKVGRSKWLFMVLMILVCMVQVKAFESTKQKARPSVDFPFERIIWTYWDSGSEQPPILVQICIQKIAKVAEKHNFKFVLVNESNARNYIENYDKLFFQVHTKSIHQSSSQTADFLRMLILQQNGGIWVDTTTVFLNGLAEIENVLSEEYSHLGVNRFSLRPEVIFFYETGEQNRVEYKIADPYRPAKNLLYNEHPSYRIWSIFAKKNSSLISEVRQIYSNFTVMSFLEVQHQLASQDIYISDIDNNQESLYLNMAIKYAIQKRQMKIDQKLGLFSKRKYAFDDYKAWGMRESYESKLNSKDDLIPCDYWFWFTKEELDIMGFHFRFFTQQFGSIRNASKAKFDFLLKNFDNNHQNYPDFAWNLMDKENCQKITFVVEGSVIDQMLRSSKIIQKHRFPAITKEQNAQWLQQCGQKHALFDNTQKQKHETLSLENNFYYKLHKQKAEQIQKNRENLSIVQQATIKWNENYVLLFQYASQMTIALILFGTYFFVRCVVAKWFRDRVERFDSGFSENTDMESDLKRKCKQNNKKVLFLTYSLVVLSTFMFSLVDMLNNKQKQKAIFGFVFTTFVIQAYIEGLIGGRKNLNKQGRSSFKSLYELFFLMVNFICGFVCMMQAWRSIFWIDWYACVLGMIGPCVFKLKTLLDEREQQASSQQTKAELKQAPQNDIMAAWIKKNPHRSAILLFLTLTILLPNLKHMSGSSGYYVKYVSFISLAYLLIVAGWTFIRCIRLFYWKQASRLFLLFLISFIAYLTVYHMDMTVQKIPRLSFYGMVLVVMSLMYVQIGSEVGTRLDVGGIFSKLSLSMWEWGFMVLPLILEVLIGLVLLDHESMRKDFVEYILHWLFFAYCVAIGELLSYMRKSSEVQSQNLHGKNLQLQTFEEVSHMNEE